MAHLSMLKLFGFADVDAKCSGRFFIDLAKSHTALARKILEVFAKPGK